MIPSAPRLIRSRVAVPVAPPVLKPSLIPFDLLQDMEREAKLQAQLEDAREERDPQTSPLPIPDDVLADDVAVLAEAPADPTVAFSALSKVSLFKQLPRPSLEALAADATQLEIPDGELLFAEGEDASSFYVVIDGTLEIVRENNGRQVALRHVAAGEAIGLFGLFSGQQRAASARAIGDSTVLVVSGAKLQSVVDLDEALHERMLRFYRERLLEGFMANKVFADIDSIARARLLGRFKHRDIAAGEAMLSPGEVTNLIAVVTYGSLVLEDRATLGAQPRQFEVGTGQFLIITCAMSGLPSKLRLFATEYATVSMLSHKDLNELTRDYPALRTLPTRLPAVARQLDRDVFCGTTGVPGL
ncbi:MAG: cyclic nucleotide-binding domain-containing protein [Archangium sp.]|nr:cyclic nucleotide-binding domain-containing protein [Archangium sp.]